MASLLGQAFPGLVFLALKYLGLLHNSGYNKWINDTQASLGHHFFVHKRKSLKILSLQQIEKQINKAMQLSHFLKSLPASVCQKTDISDSRKASHKSF